MAATDLASPVGLPLDRVDGRLKVTGKAEYAYEYAARASPSTASLLPPRSVKVASLRRMCRMHKKRRACGSC